jgi:hypothetical protein
MKFLKMGNYLPEVHHIFMDNFFTAIPLATALYEQGNFVIETISKNRKFLLQSFGNSFKFGEITILKKGQILAQME